MPTKKTSGQVRPLNLARQLPSMLKIEQECYADPWSKKTFNNCLKQKNASGMAVEFEGEFAGYLIYEKNGANYTIRNLAVPPWFQRRGLATEMLNTLKGWLKEGGKVEMFVSDHCLDAHLFLKSAGFKAEGVERKFFKINDAYEDAYHFVFRCGPATMSAHQLEEMMCQGR